MELEVLQTRGIPPSGLLSISAGGTRRQVQLSAIDRPLRFSGVDDTSQIKVDVLDVRGRARVPYDPNEQKYTLPLDPFVADPAPNEGSNMEVDILVRPCNPMTPSSPTQDLDAEMRRRKEVDAEGYLEEHGLVNFVQFLLHSLMNDKPADPYPFLQKQLAMQISKQVARGRSPSPVRGSPDSPIGASAIDITLPVSPAPQAYAQGVGGGVVPSATAAPTATGAPAVPALTGFPNSQALTVPGVQDSESDISSMLMGLNPGAAASISPEDIQKLEIQALEASKRLRADNQKLRETAEQMKLEYERLMQESRALHSKLEAKRAKKAEAALAEAQKTETKAQAAYREIEKLKNEVNDLAMENAKLVSNLAQGREMLNDIKKEISLMQRGLAD